MVKKASSTTYMNGTTSGIKDAKTIVWSRGARIAASYFSKRDTNKIHDVVNQFNAKNGFNQDLNVIYALPFKKAFKIIIQPRFDQLEVLDVVNNQNYDPNKVVEVIL